MKLKKLGNTGVLVSDICLGTMNFGMPDWGTGEDESLRILQAYLEAGGNFIDTADVYGGGASETICGKALASQRDRVILATKGHFGVVKRFGDPPAHENALGSSRLHLTRALEDSLRRLRTDYIDLYQVHCWDPVTPIEETLGTLDDFVRSGKVRYVGLSNYEAWQIAEARQLCIRHGWEPFVTAQMQYSLVCRDIESAVAPVCRRYAIGLLPWSPLGAGVLTGKYRRDETGPAGCRFGEEPEDSNTWRKRFINERNLGIVDVVSSVAKALSTTATAVSLAWLLGRPAVSSVIIGPKTVAQLEENFAGCDVALSPEHLDRLDEASRPVSMYPSDFIRHNGRRAPAE
ncbi:MAG: aldo/keto reductase [Planctomycetota bacterium]